MPTDGTGTLRIEKIVAGGEGFARRDGKALFVRGAAPGDLVSVRVVEDKGSYARAEIVELLEASPDRTFPSCPLYGTCGGCSLQHLSYETQLRAKVGILEEACARAGVSGFPIRAQPSSPFGYRNRMQFHRAAGPGGGSAKPALSKRASPELVPIADCPIAESGIRRALSTGTLVPPDGVERFQVFSQADGLLVEGRGPQRGHASVSGVPISMDVRLFFQSNLEALESLLEELLPLARRVRDEGGEGASALDLYCGVGTFARFLSDIFPSVDAVERERDSIVLAAENLKGRAAGLFALSDDQWARRPQGADYEFIVVDPPRTGLSRPLKEWLVAHKPRYLAYVSCDPVTLARDLAALERGGYDTLEATLFDFYPQTAHIETLAALRGRS